MVGASRCTTLGRSDANAHAAATLSLLDAQLDSFGTQVADRLSRPGSERLMNICSLETSVRRLISARANVAAGTGRRDSRLAKQLLEFPLFFADLSRTESARSLQANTVSNGNALRNSHAAIAFRCVPTEKTFAVKLQAHTAFANVEDLSESTSTITLVVLIGSDATFTHRIANRQQPRAGRRMSTAVKALDSTDWLVGELQRLARARTLQYTLEVGRLVVTHIFAGSLEQLRADGRRNDSYRRLAERPDLPFSAVTLWRCVKIFELIQRFPALQSNEHLALAHLRAVAALPAAAQQTLLAEAEQQAWTSEELVRAVQRTRSSRSDGERPSPRSLARSARRIKRLARNLESELDAAPAQLQQGLSPEARAALVRIRHELACIAGLVAQPTDSEHEQSAAGSASGVHRVAAKSEHH